MWPKELEEHKGGKHYIAHFPVVKPSSTSTKVRVVSDSALKNNVTGYSLNDLIRPVPNALADILTITLRWRTHPTAIMYDLSKAYQSIRTGTDEKFLRLLLWREDPGQPWETWAFNRNNFGDKCASLALEIGKKATALRAQNVDSLAANQLVDCSFVDDVGGGGSLSEVMRMRGDLQEDGSYSGTIPQVLKVGGFQAKSLVVSKHCTPEEAESLG